MKIETVRGPWFSLGVHVDFQKRYIDLHIIWWIVTIGQDYRDVWKKYLKFSDWDWDADDW